ncbi:MAG: hypothetical protein ACPGTO_09835 [Polaribacter sp.]
MLKNLRVSIKYIILNNMTIKNLKLLIVFTFLLATISCTKESAIEPAATSTSNKTESSSNIVVETSKGLNETASTGSYSWEETPESFEEELLAIMQSAEHLSSYELKRMEINIRVLENGIYLFTQTLHEVPVPMPMPGAIVCAGSGVSFARCCGDWLEANPDGCLTICSDGSGGYTADDNGC